MKECRQLKEEKQTGLKVLFELVLVGTGWTVKKLAVYPKLHCKERIAIHQKQRVYECWHSYKTVSFITFVGCSYIIKAVYNINRSSHRWITALFLQFVSNFVQVFPFSLTLLSYLTLGQRSQMRRRRTRESEAARGVPNAWRQMDECVSADMTVVHLSPSTKFTHSGQILQAVFRQAWKSVCIVCVCVHYCEANLVEDRKTRLIFVNTLIWLISKVFHNHCF